MGTDRTGIELVTISWEVAKRQADAVDRL